MKLQVSAVGFAACQGCGIHATLRTLDVRTKAIAECRIGGFKRRAIPAGWCPLIALCGMCWTEVRSMLRDKATPDSSGEISPP
jgi:hypothetical protein